MLQVVPSLHLGSELIYQEVQQDLLLALVDISGVYDVYQCLEGEDKNLLYEPWVRHRSMAFISCKAPDDGYDYYYYGIIFNGLPLFLSDTTVGSRGNSFDTFYIIIVVNGQALRIHIIHNYFNRILMPDVQGNYTVENGIPTFNVPWSRLKNESWIMRKSINIELVGPLENCTYSTPTEEECIYNARRNWLKYDSSSTMNVSIHKDQSCFVDRFGTMHYTQE
eukprot:872577-Pleurochrysis_carterae.AAC.1